MNKKILVLFAVSLTLAVFVIGAKLYRDQQAKPVEQEGLVRPHAPWLGEENAPVTVVEFFDPECESCRRFHPMTKMLLDEFKGKVKLVLRYAPFHQNSQFAVKILEAARKQNHYWQTLDVLYHYQPQWGDHHHPRPELIWNYLPEVAGLDVERVRRDMEDPAIQNVLQQDIEDGRKLGVQRTPQFFVNGEPLVDFGYENLRQLVLKYVKP